MNFISKRQTPSDLVNDAIRFKEVLVIGPKGEQLGILTRREALDRAAEANLDLLCVSPNGNPPVCKILDYGRYRYEQQKRTREAKKNQSVTQIKPLRLSPVIEEHDFNTKLRHARKWLDEGIKVKVDMRFRGRLITRLEVGRKTMDAFIEACNDLGSVEKTPKLEGNTMSCVISPLKKRK
ncbi:translation initiation factor IF-3 [Erysipelothrix larvae]|uniref:Translation initiation factor IF-3 n=1 Tax=Erysipelothrix larvae TaxID=1514105 RepID=A0A0X8GZI5_9FIRM|nr:translation initiation factor IF-3 [Erysipelothrix larvae]AMC93244.1 translation initiation factor IF-3 [Erysipelothrix larvae]